LIERQPIQAIRQSTASTYYNRAQFLAAHINGVQSLIRAESNVWGGVKVVDLAMELKSSAPHLLMLWGSRAVFAPLQPDPVTLVLSPLLVEQSVGATVLVAEFKTIIR
jgi:hypothetical protein